MNKMNIEKIRPYLENRQNEYNNFSKDRYIKLRNAGFRCTCCGSSPEGEEIRLVIYNGRVMCEECKQGLILSETEEPGENE